MQLHVPGLHAWRDAPPRGESAEKVEDAGEGQDKPVLAGAHGERDSPDDTRNETEVLSIWPEGPDLVVERAREGAGRCSDVEVEVLHGAALPRSTAGGGSGASAAAGAIRERAHALREHVEEFKADLAKRF